MFKGIHWTDCKIQRAFLGYRIQQRKLRSKNKNRFEITSEDKIFKDSYILPSNQSNITIFGSQNRSFNKLFSISAYKKCCP